MEGREGETEVSRRRTDINLCCVRERRRRKRAGEKTPFHIFCPEVLEPEEEEERKMGKGEKSMKY